MEEEPQNAPDNLEEDETSDSPDSADQEQDFSISGNAAREQQRMGFRAMTKEGEQQAVNKAQDLVKKRAMQAAMQAARAAAVAAWTAVTAAIGPYAAIILVCLLIIVIIAVPAVVIFSKSNGGTFGNQAPDYVQAYDGLTSQQFLELLSKNPGGLNLPYDTNKYGNTLSSGGRFGAENPDRKGHRGIDIGLPIGVHYYSIADGEVIYLSDTIADSDSGVDLKNNGVGKNQNHGFGNAIAVKISSGKWAGYIFEIHHLKQGSATGLGLKKGSLVKTGQPIGMTGHNGSSTGPHLHFSIAFPEPRGHCETFIKNVGQPCSAPDGKLTSYFVNPRIPLGWVK